MDKEVLENHTRYLERKALYKSFGCDIDAERAFILEKAKPISGAILEAGTGKGHFALALAQAGYRFTTFDISEEEQKFARLNVKYFKLDHLVDFRIENGERLSFKDKSFDTIFSVNTLHHLVNPYKVLDELIRLLTYNGKLILSDFNAKGLALMDAIHASQGGRHRAGNVTLSDVEHYLKTKDLWVNRISSTFQDVLIAHY